MINRNRDEMLIPRSIRCTKAEHRYLSDLIKKLREQPDRITTPTIPKEAPKPVSRIGITPEEFLKQQGYPTPSIIDAATNDESEDADYTAWQTDPLMREIDRGCVYEIDGFGYPEEAERFARKYPQLWGKMFKAKREKKTALYNEIMATEVWEVVKNGNA